MNIVDAIKAAQSTNNAIRLKKWPAGAVAVQMTQSELGMLNPSGKMFPFHPNINDFMSKHWELVPGVKFDRTE